MLGMSGLLGNSTGNHEGEVGVFGEEERERGEEGDRNFTGNRWPRQATLALLNIRSDMDVAFRDSTLKGPLWEDVSRKLAELGYHRSAKKCKEKFENVDKYYKRTKGGRSARQDGKTYRFFDQLEALHNHPSHDPSSSLPLIKLHQPHHQDPTMVTPTISTNKISQLTLPSSLHNLSTDFTSTSISFSSSSDEESEDTRKKKTKMANFFDSLMKEMIKKQEILQKEFLEAIERHEHQRMVREEAWKMQELARVNREHEILVQERSIAAAKDAAVIAFLQKITEQSNQVQLQENPSSSEKIEEYPQSNNGVNFLPTSSSRWPKSEVETLIKLRTGLDVKYQDINGPKGHLWEEISTAMRRLGYTRSPKRCKEKWENINKYFKKVKESNKRRPEDSKTCPYFHQLDALYKEKTKKIDNSFAPAYDLKQEDLLVQMISSRPPESVMEDLGTDNNIEQNHEEDGEDEDEDEDERSGYEIVAHNTSSMTFVE